MCVLLVTMYFPPAGGGGVARGPEAGNLPERGIETHVLAPDDPKWLYRDDALDVPPRARVHRVRYVGGAVACGPRSCTGSRGSTGCCGRRRSSRGGCSCRTSS